MDRSIQDPPNVGDVARQAVSDVVAVREVLLKGQPEHPMTILRDRATLPLRQGSMSPFELRAEP